jgi:hypothetical protein
MVIRMRKGKKNKDKEGEKMIWIYGGERRKKNHEEEEKEKAGEGRISNMKEKE